MYESIEFIIACAGKSTRNYPHSKGIAHKCLMPFGDVRLIDVVLEDIIKMGGRHITMVCSDQTTIDAFKEALKTDTIIEQKFRLAGRESLANILKATFLPENIDLKFVIQKTPIGTAQVLGIAHKLSPSRHGVLIFPDDLIDSSKAEKPFVQKIVNEFLKNPQCILGTGIEKDDVTNNAIIHNGRIFEKPKNPANNIGIYSPIVFPKEALDFAMQETEKFEQTGVLPPDLSVGEWVYTDVANAFLNTAPDFSIDSVRLNPEKYELLDTGALHLYEKALLRELVTRSYYAGSNRQYMKELLSKERS